MPHLTIPAEFAHAPMAYAGRHFAPQLTAALNGLSQAVHQHSILPLRVYEAARARIAEINGCLLCQRYRPAADIPAGAQAGERGPAPDEALYANVSDWRTSPVYSERERVAIDFAERFALTPYSLGYDDEFWFRARAVFSEAELYDLTISVASCLAAGRVSHVLGFDQTSCSVGEALEDWGFVEPRSAVE
jgi:alkylhydroperoxidase family enzyme